ncbi:MAG: hypothetical protein AB3X41_04810 [Leptothrix ochracea]|jgi:hypothetical protein|uniref:hypothetical protein n=1 Tax=Leptothrix ochracea TaxID=735331 RepID=UPI0034E261E4
MTSSKNPYCAFHSVGAGQDKASWRTGSNWPHIFAFIVLDRPSASSIDQELGGLALAG